MSKDFRNEVIQIVATQPISETCEAGIFVQTVQMFGYQACDVWAQLEHVFLWCLRLDENNGISFFK